MILKHVLEYMHPSCVNNKTTFFFFLGGGQKNILWERVSRFKLVFLSKVPVYDRVTLGEAFFASDALNKSRLSDMTRVLDTFQ